MYVQNNITIDLARGAVPAVVDVMQGDDQTRKVSVSLFSSGVPWMPPEDAEASIAFDKPDRTSGWYDRLPDNTAACEIADNVVTATLAIEVMQISGDVNVSVILRDNALHQIAAFPFIVRVHKNPAFGNAISNSYYHIQTLDDINQFSGGFMKITYEEQDGHWRTNYSYADLYEMYTSGKLQTLRFVNRVDGYECLATKIDIDEQGGIMTLHTAIGVFNFYSDNRIIKIKEPESGGGSYVVKANITYDEENNSICTVEEFNWEDLLSAVVARKAIFCQLWHSETIVKQLPLVHFTEDDEYASFAIIEDSTCEQVDIEIYGATSYTEYSMRIMPLYVQYTDNSRTKATHNARDIQNQARSGAAVFFRIEDTYYTLSRFDSYEAVFYGKYDDNVNRYISVDNDGNVCERDMS